MRWCLWGDRPKASLTYQPPSLIVKKGDCLAGGWDQNQMEFWQPPLNGQTYLPLVPADRKGGGAGVSHLGPDRKQMWNFWSFFPVKFDSLTQKTHFNSHFMPFKWLSKWGAGLLQMMIWSDRPLTNDHQEGPASYKWPSGGAGLLQMMIRRAAAVRAGIGDFSSCMEIDFFLCKLWFRTHGSVCAGREKWPFNGHIFKK